MEDSDYGNIPPQAYDGYIEQIGSAIQEASGYQKKALEAQMENARAARENAMEIAQLQASTSRYGVDVASQDRMRALKENARQFDATHGLEIAKAYTAFSSTPDLMFARNDFMSAMGRVGQGLNPRPVTSQGTPQAKTWEDFSALAQYNGSQVPGGGGGGGGGNAQPASSAGTGRANLVTSGPAGTEAKPAPDPRLKAANAIMQAIPPSPTEGADGQDWHAINAIVEMFKAGNPAIQKLGPARTKIALAGAARAGYDPGLLYEDFLRSVPGQRSPLLSA